MISPQVLGLRLVQVVVLGLRLRLGLALG